MRRMYQKCDVIGPARDFNTTCALFRSGNMRRGAMSEMVGGLKPGGDSGRRGFELGGKITTCHRMRQSSRMARCGDRRSACRPRRIRFDRMRRNWRWISRRPGGSRGPASFGGVGMGRPFPRIPPARRDIPWLVAPPSPFARVAGPSIHVGPRTRGLAAPIGLGRRIALCDGRGVFRTDVRGSFGDLAAGSPGRLGRSPRKTV